MKPQLNKATIYRFMRFVLVGVVNTVIDLAFLNLLVYLFNVENPFVFAVCKGASFTLAVINSYFMNKYFTFAKKKTTRRDFYIFVLISLIGLFINMAISGLMFYILSAYPEIFSVHLIATLSGIIGALFTVVINYLSYSYFVFKND